jgi:hypothetical protein
MAVEIFILLVLLLAITYGILSTIMCELDEWNKGVCKYSGKPWVYFDTDSSGARGFTDGEDHHVWISWIPRKITSRDIIEASKVVNDDVQRPKQDGEEDIKDNKSDI